MDSQTFLKDASFYLNIPLAEGEVEWERHPSRLRRPPEFPYLQEWLNFNINNEGNRPFNNLTGLVIGPNSLLPIHSGNYLISGKLAGDRPKGRHGYECYGWDGILLWHEIFGMVEEVIEDKFWSKLKRQKNRGFYYDDSGNKLPMAGWWIAKWRFKKVGKSITPNIKKTDQWYHSEVEQVPSKFSENDAYVIDLFFVSPTAGQTKNPSNTMLLRIGFQNALCNPDTPCRLMQYPSSQEQMIPAHRPYGTNYGYGSYNIDESEWKKMLPFKRWWLKVRHEISLMKIKKEAGEDDINYQKLKWEPRRRRNLSDLDVDKDRIKYKRLLTSDRPMAYGARHHSLFDIMSFYDSEILDLAQNKVSMRKQQYISLDFIQIAPEEWEKMAPKLLRRESDPNVGSPPTWFNFSNYYASRGNLQYLGPSLKNKKVEEQKTAKQKYTGVEPVEQIALINYPVRLPKVVRADG